MSYVKHTDTSVIELALDVTKTFIKKNWLMLNDQSIGEIYDTVTSMRLKVHQIVEDDKQRIKKQKEQWDSIDVECKCATCLFTPLGIRRGLTDYCKKAVYLFKEEKWDLLKKYPRIWSEKIQIEDFELHCNDNGEEYLTCFQIVM